MRLDTSNIELSVSLLDQRFLIGDSGLANQLTERFRRCVHWRREALIRNLCEMTRTRHAKFHNTIYHLEPNLRKARAASGTFTWCAGWRLREAAEDVAGLAPAIAFLSAVRCRLHYKAGRDSNILTFDIQEELAEDPAGCGSTTATREKCIRLRCARSKSASR